MRPETSTISLKVSTWEWAFWPTVASITNSTEWGAVASAFLITRTIFTNSAIRSFLFCNRPAVSTSSTSARPSFARPMASKINPAASAPGSPETTGQPVRWPQICNCSTAAARKVSPAANITEWPSWRHWLASLAMVVVLPEPLTPQTKTTKGRCRKSMASGRATGSSMKAISSASRVLTSCGVISLSSRFLASDSFSFPAVATPRSPAISTSSSSSRAARSNLRLVKRSAIPPVSLAEDRPRPPRSRSSHPCPAALMRPGCQPGSRRRRRSHGP